MPRLFFALWPDQAVARRLEHAGAALQRTCGGRLARLDTLHLTLAFLGETPAERLPEALDAAATAHCAPFTLTLARVGGWAHNRIVWAAPVETPPPLLALARSLEAALGARGIAFDARPFAPHVTLLRKAERLPPVPSLPPIAWPVTDFVLVKSLPGARGAAYETLGRWPA